MLKWGSNAGKTMSLYWDVHDAKTIVKHSRYEMIVVVRRSLWHVGRPWWQDDINNLWYTHTKAHTYMHIDLGPIGPRWAPCCPHKSCYQVYITGSIRGTSLIKHEQVSLWYTRRTYCSNIEHCVGTTESLHLPFTFGIHLLFHYIIFVYFCSTVSSDFRKRGLVYEMKFYELSLDGWNYSVK